MPIHNKYFFRKKPDGSLEFHPGPLHKSGPVLPIEIHIPTALAAHYDKQNQTPPSPGTGLALIDTGATNSAVDKKIISSLSVKPVGVIDVGTASGIVQQETYPAKLSFPVEKIEVEFSRMAGVDLGGQTVDDQPIIALIGRDLLTRWVLIYNGPGGWFTIAF